MSTSQRTREEALRYAQARAASDLSSNRPTGLDLGENVVWLRTDPNGIRFFRICQHDGVNSEGNYLPALDLSTVFAPNSALYSVFEDVITDEEIDLYAEYGDPCVRLVDALIERLDLSFSDIKRLGDKKSPLRKYQYYTNAVIEGKGATILRIPKTVVEEIGDFPDWTSFFDNPQQALRITGGTGDNGFREYKAPKPFNSECPVPDIVKTTDLNRVARQLYIPYHQKVTYVFRSYPKAIEAAGLTPQDFGVDHLVD